MNQALCRFHAPPACPIGDIPHKIGCGAIEAVDPVGEIQRLLHGPDVIVPIGRQDAGRVPDGHPSDRHRGPRIEPGAQMHRSVDAYLAAVADPGAMEDGSPGRDEYLVLKLCAGHMRVRTDQAIVTDQAGVSGAAAHDGVLHDDAAAADADGATSFSDDARAMQYACARANGDVTANCCIRRDPRGWVDLRTLALVSNEHMPSSR